MPVRRMVRVVEAGERLVVEFPWAARNRAVFKEAFDVDAANVGWTVTRADRRSRRARSARAAGGGRPPAVPSGVLELRLLAGKKGDPASGDLLAAEPRADARADRCAREPLGADPPVLAARGVLPARAREPRRGARGEGVERHDQGEDCLREERVPLPELSEFLRYNGHADYLLDQSAFDAQKVFDRVHGDFQHSCMYYS